MNKLIPLHDRDDTSRTLWVNAAHVLQAEYVQCGNYTIITLVAGRALLVTERPEEIARLMNGTTES